MIRKKDIYAGVAEATGAKKKDVRLITDALLDFLRTQLEAGEEVQCPPLGKIRVVVQNAGTEKQRNVYKLVLAKEKVADGDDTDAAEGTD